LEIEAGSDIHKLRQRSLTHFAHHLAPVRLHRDFADIENTADLLVQPATALALVVKHEADIRAFAVALLKRGALTGREAHEICRDTGISALRSKIADRERRALRSRRGDHWRGY
jgi:hypothetical protein